LSKSLCHLLIDYTNIMLENH